jgi:hypothetical protein
MIVSSPARKRLGRALNAAQNRRGQRLDGVRVRSELAAFRTTAELSELSGIAARNGHADTVELRTVLVKALARD